MASSGLHVSASHPITVYRDDIAVPLSPDDKSKIEKIIRDSSSCDCRNSSVSGQESKYPEEKAKELHDDIMESGDSSKESSDPEESDDSSDEECSKPDPEEKERNDNYDVYGTYYRLSKLGEEMIERVNSSEEYIEAIKILKAEMDEKRKKKQLWLPQQIINCQ